MSFFRRLSRMSVVWLLLAGVCGAAIYRAFQARSSAAVQLSSFAPEGALLAIESPDFAGLLKSWTSSAEENRWLASDNYAGFSRSRLFSRLTEAQGEFAATAGLPADAGFVQQVAGGQSLLAWYDVGTLQFLYITRMPSGEAEKTPLLKLRDKFEERKVGDDSFFVRTQSADENSTARTVAFAVHGDYLLLATREDLIAGALQAMQQPASRALQNEAWYASTVAAANRQPGDLRMTLKLSELVSSGYFRTYWIQQNITEMKQYSAALSDLYRGPNTFREERVLLAAGPERVSASTDLQPVLAYLPKDAGFYRAIAQPDTATVLDQLQDKLLDRSPTNFRDARIAPVANLATPVAGDSTSLEERIDEPVVVAQPRSAQLAPLSDLLNAAQVQAMMAFSATDPVTSAANVLAPIHTAVVLSSSSGWDQAKLQQGLIAALSPRLTVGATGLNWQQHSRGKGSFAVLSGMAGLAIAVQGKICVMASDEATLLHMLDAAQGGSGGQRVATTIAGFDHSTERRRFVQLADLFDNVHPDRQRPAAEPKGQGSVPPFFAGNMVSLSDTFQDLDSETFTESTTPDKVTHQTVLYQWRR